MEGNEREDGLSPLDPLGDLAEAQELHRDGARNLRPDPDTQPARDRAQVWGAEQAFRALSQVASTITANLEFRSLVQQILDLALEAVGAKRGIIFLGKGRLSELVPVVARTLSGDDLKELKQISQTILHRAQTGNAVFSDDATHDARFVDVPSIQAHQVRSIICLPLMTKDKMIGMIYIDHPEHDAFPQHARDFFEAFASLAAVALENARLHGDLRCELGRMRRQMKTTDSFGRLVTVSPKMIALLKRAALVAQVDTPIMILGDSGTGKELLARAIHEASPRGLNPFLAYNCAAIPRELMESLFFGHARGAFTGAVRDMPGLFRQADHGVLFLDEIADLDLGLQAKLLRVIEDGMIWPVGSGQEISVDVRVMTATGRDLEQAVRKGDFREDLFYRLNVLELRIPTLRERQEDIPVLADHFLQKYASTEGEHPHRVTFTERAMEFLQALPWNGNVRELENLIHRILVLTEDDEVTIEQIKRVMSFPVESRESVAHQEDRESTEEQSARKTLPQQERESIMQALLETHGNKTKAAVLLGIHRNSLTRRMERLDIEWEE